MPYVTNAGAKIYWEEASVQPQSTQNPPRSPTVFSAISAVPAVHAGPAAAERDPLLLIMGLGATLEWWRRLIPILAPRYRTIVYDNRGVGRSDVPPGPYSIPVMADDAAAVLNAAGISSAHVFGASMGGMIAQELALNHPLRVRSLILGCTACGGRQSVPAGKDVAAALGARLTMTREEAMWAMAPYIFDASTPRERVAEDIDAIVRPVRGTRWQASHPGDREVRVQIRKVLRNHGLPASGELFDRAYAYIAEHY